MHDTRASPRYLYMCRNSCCCTSYDVDKTVHVKRNDAYRSSVSVKRIAEGARKFLRIPLVMKNITIGWERRLCGQHARRRLSPKEKHE